MGVSGYFDRSADEAARRLGVGPRFRDTDPRPLPDEGGLGLAALIPTEGRIGDSHRRVCPNGTIRSSSVHREVARREDERLIASLADDLADLFDLPVGEVATAIREWRDGVRGRR